MRRGTLTLLFFIILIAAGSSFIVFWPNPKDGQPWNGINNPYEISRGLDLAGGIKVILQPREGERPTAEQMENVRKVLDSRINGLGLKEPNIRVVQSTDGLFSISVELPYLGDGSTDQQAVDNLVRTGELEFWNTGPNGILPEGTTLDVNQFLQYNPGGKPIFTGRDIDANKLGVSQQESSTAYQINFAMQGDAITKFAEFTGNNIGTGMTITLDKQVIASATIQSQISTDGRITGRFTREQAESIVNTLKYGALPVTLEKTDESIVDATLGEQAIQNSLIAGAIGLAVVILFMLLYYRLPGFLADIALILYAIMTFAIFKLIGVTLTLAGIAGFILSIGMAVDANVLIFERVKEELRDGRLLSSAIDIGWKRAWPSIRDSNIATVITCIVLYAFGSTFGASIIIGFATTLFLGVLVSMFTAITVTRTLLNLLVPTGVINHPALFGLPANAIPSVARRNSAV